VRRRPIRELWLPGDPRRKPGFSRSAVLAARGRAETQAGLIHLHTMETVYHSVAPQLQASCFTLATGAQMIGPQTAVLLGPGLAAPDIPTRSSYCPAICGATRHSGSRRCQRIGLAFLDPGPKNAVRVITPHPGEAAPCSDDTPRYKRNGIFPGRIEGKPIQIRCIRTTTEMGESRHKWRNNSLTRRECPVLPSPSEQNGGPNRSLGASPG